MKKPALLILLVLWSVLLPGQLYAQDSPYEACFPNGNLANCISGDEGNGNPIYHSVGCTSDSCLCETDNGDKGADKGYWFDYGANNVDGTYKIRDCDLWVDYCEENEYADQSVSACKTCPAGTTRPAGDDPLRAATACEATLCAVNQFVSSNACTVCPVGSTNAVGDDASGGDTSCDFPEPLILRDGFESQ